MPRDVTYTMLVSLDGYMEGPDGRFGWAMPDHEIHGFVNDLCRRAGAFVYGRGMYETMTPWATMGDEPGASAEVVDFAQIWKATPKVVVSSTLDSAEHARLEPGDAVEVVRALKAQDGGPIDVGGAALAGSLIRAGLVEEIGLVVFPVLVGGGKRALPDLDEVRPLSLVETRTFGNGATYSRYRF